MSEHGFSKDPLTPSHADLLVDQSFQSLKSKETRDSMTPTHDLKFHSLALNNPNSSGWNVQSSAEVTPDGRGFRSETVATTDGTEKVNGGVAEFQGRNEQRASGSHEGDDKNFVKKASESSNTHLKEHVVIGDENSGRIEKKMSSSTSTSHSQVVSSSQTVNLDDAEPLGNRYVTDSRHQQKQFEEEHRQRQRSHDEEYRQHEQKVLQHRAHQEEKQNRHLSEHSSTEEHHHNHHHQREEQQREHVTEQYNRNQKEQSSERKVETQNYQEQSRKYVDMDKASPEYQQHVQHLMSQAGEIISNTVEYPKPNVKMITTVKRLPDGTIVRNKRYETEELQPSSDVRKTSTSSTSNQQQHHQQHQQRVETEENLKKHLHETREHGSSPRRVVNSDAVDNVETSKHIQELANKYGEEVKHSYASSKSQRFATESSSETVQESSNVRSHPKTQDFSTHGFPSVRPEKFTQEYPTERPHGQRDEPEIKMVSQVPRVEKTIGPNGEVIVKVSSERVQNIKHKTSSERVTATEIKERFSERPEEDYPNHGYPAVQQRSPTKDSAYSQSNETPRQRSKSPDFSTHGFPSVRSPHKPEDGTSRQRSNSPDFSTHGFPSVRSPSKPSPGEITHHVSSEKVHKSSYNTNAEHVVEKQRVHHDDYSRSSQDFSTNGFPSVKSPTKSRPDQSTERKPHSQPDGYAPKSKTPSSTTKKTSTTETSQRVVQKEKEVDAAHRAFAASLRSSSPIDGIRRDSTDHHHRQTPRSSISSARTYRRDAREGSHDSNAHSESSRFSGNTVTRHSPAKTVTKTVTTRPSILKTKQTNGSSETIDLPSPRSPKSPSPGKTVTTTTTRITSTTHKKPSPLSSTTTAKPDNINKTKKFSNNQTTNTKNKFTQIVEEPYYDLKDFLNYPINASLTQTDNHSNEPHIAKTATKHQTLEAIHETPTSPNAIVEAPCLKKIYYRLGPRGDHHEHGSDSIESTPKEAVPVENLQLITQEPSTNKDQHNFPITSNSKSSDNVGSVSF